MTGGPRPLRDWRFRTQGPCVPVYVVASSPVGILFPVLSGPVRHMWITLLVVSRVVRDWRFRMEKVMFAINCLQHPPSPYLYHLTFALQLPLNLSVN